MKFSSAAVSPELNVGCSNLQLLFGPPFLPHPRWRPLFPGWLCVAPGAGRPLPDFAIAFDDIVVESRKVTAGGVTAANFPHFLINSRRSFDMSISHYQVSRNLLLSFVYKSIFSGLRPTLWRHKGVPKVCDTPFIRRILLLAAQSFGS